MEYAYLAIVLRGGCLGEKTSSVKYDWFTFPKDLRAKLPPRV
jgi:hypothetical protein